MAILLKKIMLEFGFIKQIRTTWGNKEVLQTFFHNFFYSRKYDLICLIRAFGNHAFVNLVTSQKIYCGSALVASIYC